MSREVEREDRCIRNTDVRKTVHLQILIHNTALFTRQHCTRARWVEFGADLARKPRVPLVVRLHTRARADLRACRRVERRRAANRARELQALTQDRDVSLVREVLRVDRRGVEGVVGGEVDPALGERVLERGLDGDRARAVECEEELDLRDARVEEGVQGGVVDRTVPCDDRRVGARAEGRLGGRELACDLLLERGGGGCRAKEGCQIDVGNSGVDGGKKGGVGRVAVRVIVVQISL